MKKRTGDDWFPFWIDKWLFGSTRDELTVEQCAVWVDFLALSNKDDGYIRANEGMPYPIKRLAGLLNRSEKLIQQTIDRCLDPKVNKLRLEPDGTLYMLSHDEYELSERHKRRLDDKVEPSLLKEKDIKKLILDKLNEKNLSYETEKICESGRIDIFIPGNPNQIIEIKSDNSADSIRAGMRQLLDYGIAFPGSILFIVFPGNISTRLKTKLKNHRIKIWKFPTKGHDDRQKDAKRREEKRRVEERRVDKDKKKKVKDIHMSASFKNNVIFKWNEFAQKYNLPAIKEIKAKSLRERNLKARNAEKDFSFDILIDMIENSPFLLGKTKHAFFVFFDWIIKPSNYQKIMEGNYLDRQGFQKFSGIVEGIKELEEKYRNEGRK